MEFNAFPKIERIGKMFMQITQKIHGTNAQVYIYEEDGQKRIKAGSRTRWITPTDDNYGFASFVYDNADELIEKLGPGHHYGEWAGPGINSGEGLAQKTFILFDFWKYKELPKQCATVPELYTGPIDFSMIEKCEQLLKTKGSAIVPGFMRVEGMVIRINGERFKKVFDANETKWTKADPIYSAEKEKARMEKLTAMEKYNKLFEPERLEKLLSRDERFLRDYPKSLPEICGAYYDDLRIENAMDQEAQDDYVKWKGNLFKFVRTTIENFYQKAG